MTRNDKCRIDCTYLPVVKVKVHLGRKRLHRQAGSETTPRLFVNRSSAHFDRVIGNLPALLLFSLLALWLPCASQTAQAATNSFAYSGIMRVARQAHTATLLQNGKVLVAGGSTDGSDRVSSAELYDPATGTWAFTGDLTYARCNHTATLLPNGKVLVTGGYESGVQATAEIYDPATGVWTATQNLSIPRVGHTATLLPNGQVLVAGGSTTGSPGVVNTAELYDPSTGTWTTANHMMLERTGHTATLLPNGKVLVTGGNGDGNTGAQAAAELYDPTNGTWTSTGSLMTPRLSHTATLLPNGQVLIAGGTYSSYATSYLSSAELYDPTTGIWTATGSLTYSRINDTATLLPNGKVIVTGGYLTDALGLARAELYDPASGTWTLTGNMRAARFAHNATLLPNGKLLVTGGTGNAYPSPNSTATTELYDSAAGTFAPTGPLTDARALYTTTLLPNGMVLSAGGYNGQILSGAELYNSATQSWNGTGSLYDARYVHTATLLSSGQVLVAGGAGAQGTLTSAELYDPAGGTWSATGSLNIARLEHTATLLPNGKVLVVGGASVLGSGLALASAELYDPLTGVWSFTGGLTHARCNHSATLLPTGQVLVTGGSDASGTILTATSELYDPTTGTWSATGNLSAARQFHSATLLPNGKVLVAGGAKSGGYLATAEIYSPAGRIWSTGSTLAAARANHTATLLPNGQVLVTGGNSATGALASAELYDPAGNTWSTAASLSGAHYSHMATLLLGGQILVAGGYDGTSYTGMGDLYDVGLGFSVSAQPQISSVSSPVRAGTALSLTGANLLGLPGGSGGSSFDSPTNYPVVQLRSLANDQIVYLLPAASQIRSDSNFVSVSVNGLPQGYAAARVFTNGIPSNAAVVQLLPNAPAVISRSSTGISTTGATLQATIAPNGAPATVTFDYSTDVSFTNAVVTTATQSIAGSSNSPVTQTISGLSPHTTYYYRVNAANTGGATVSSISLFKTANSSPSAGTSTAQVNTGDIVTVTLPFTTPDADGDTVTVQSVSAGAGAPFTLGTVTGNTVPVSGKLNAVGTGTLNFTVTDGFGGTSSGSIQVTVLDSLPPTFTSVPSDMTVIAASGASGTAVNYPAATATDNIGVTSLAANIASKSTFPLGHTTVTFTAKDAAGNTSTASFVVTVVEPPTVGTGGVSVTGGSSATVSGSLIANGLDSTVTFEYGTSKTYDKSIAAVPGTVNAWDPATSVSAALTGLLPHTLYHYRLNATNGAGTSYGNDATFMTADVPPTAGTSTLEVNAGQTVTATLPFPNPDASGDNVSVQSISASNGAPFTLGTVSGGTVSVRGLLNAVGTGTINFTVTDGFGGSAQGSVTVTVIDATKPTFTSVSGNITVEAPSGASGIAVNYPAPTATDNISVASLTENYPSGSTFPVGKTAVTCTAADAAGNTTTASFTVTVLSGDAESTPLGTKGTTVQGDGIPDGAVWASIGVPCATATGDAFFKATLRSGKRSQNDIILLSGATGNVAAVVQAGSTVSGLTDVTFSGFKDPLAIATAGGQEVMTCLATIAGKGVTASNNQVVVRNWLSNGVIVKTDLLGRSRVSIDAVGAKTAKFNSFGLGPDGTVWALVTLVPGSGGVTGSTNIALLSWAPESTIPVEVLRKGETLALSDGKAHIVSTIATLAAAGGSPGHGRWECSETLIARIGFTDGSSEVVTSTNDGTLAEAARKGGSMTLLNAAGAVETVGAHWLNFGLPALDPSGGRTVKADIVANIGGITSSNATGIFRQETGAAEWMVLVTQGDSTGLSDGSIFSSISDPVSNSAGTVTFIATELAGARKTAALWNSSLTGSGPSESRVLTQIAAVNQIAPETGGALFAGFVSVALPEWENAGPLVIATLKSGPAGTASHGKITPANKTGLWGVDFDGNLRLLLRTGSPLPGAAEGSPVVKTFSVLQAVAGSTGQSRAVDDLREVFCNVTYANGTTAVVKIQVP